MSSLQNAIFGVNVIFPAFSILAASVRLRRSLGQGACFQSHDAYLVAALACGITEAVLQCVLTHFGLGMHVSTAPGMDPRSAAAIVAFDKIYVTYFVAYFACNMFVKLSLVAFYRKLAPDHRYAWFLLLLDIAAVVFGVASILTALMSCTPLSKLWNPEQPGRCVDREAFFYFNGSFMIFIDIILYLTPIMIVRGVKLSRQKVMAMNVLFGLGFVVIIASLMRIVAIHNLFSNPDWSLYYNGMLLIWCTFENHLALTLICLPAVKASLLAVAPSLGSSAIWSRLRGRSTSAEGTPAASKATSARRNKSWNWSGEPSNKASIVGGRGGASTNHGDEIELRKDVYVSCTDDDEVMSIGCRGDKNSMV